MVAYFCERRFKCIYLVLLLSTIASLPFYGNAQGKPLVKWKAEIVKINQNDAKVCFIADIKEGWHVYSQFQENLRNGVDVRFNYTLSEKYEFYGTVKEFGSSLELIDPIFRRPVRWLHGVVTYEQMVTVKARKIIIKGTIQYSVCNYEECVPGQFEFEVRLN